MFVFLSGMAASIAFGGTFLRQGLLMGTARIVHRCWQLLIAHLGLFFTVAMVVIAGTRWYGDTDYVEVLGLQRFFADTPNSLIGLFTLTYVPHYFDILPVYIVVLAMVPVAMLLARINPLLVPAVSVVLYIAAVRLGLNFPANADEQAEWFFNPFAWQLIFFTGFSRPRLDQRSARLQAAAVGQHPRSRRRPRHLAADRLHPCHVDRHAAHLDHGAQHVDRHDM